MKTIVFLDKEKFSYNDFYSPIGGAQSAFIELVNGFLELGFRVEVRNFCDQEYISKNLTWKNLDYEENLNGDLFIVNRSLYLLQMVPRGMKAFVWLHNTAGYLMKLKNLIFLIKYRPLLIFSGSYHRSTFPLWAIFNSRIIPYGRSKLLLKEIPVSKIPEKPRAIFTSNPLRSLDWLVDRWIEIRELVPNAELHIFSGSKTYGTWGESLATKMNKALSYASQNSDSGIFVHEPLSKVDLINELKLSRLMLYKGDKAETFCLAIDEALALGIPCISMDLGSMKERISSGQYGAVCHSDSEFVERSVEGLTNSGSWNSWNKNIIKSRSKRESWQEVASKFIEFNG